MIQEIRAFNRYYTQILGLLDRHLVQSPFSLTEARILYELHFHQPCKASQLVQMLQLDKGLVSRILTSFERKKLLSKRRDDADSRSWLLRLTPFGEESFQSIHRASSIQISNLLQERSVAEQGQIVQNMQSLRYLLTGGKEVAGSVSAKDAFTIRTDLQPGDLSYLIYLHGKVYQEEYQYGISFESYVAKGIAEFYQQYDPARNRIWIVEYLGIRVGFLVLMDRGSLAQLRYFLFDRPCRGFGLGKRLMELFMQFLRECGYEGAYLWTVDGLPAAASLYQRFGFRLTEEQPSTAFGKPLMEQRYDLILTE